MCVNSTLPLITEKSRALEQTFDRIDKLEVSGYWCVAMILSNRTITVLCYPILLSLVLVTLLIVSNATTTSSSTITLLVVVLLHY